MEPALTGMKGNEMEFYAYESHASAYNEQRTPEDDVTIGSPPAPAGRVRGFDREEERDRWVKEGPTVILNSYGFPPHYRHRTAITGQKARAILRCGVKRMPFE